LARHPGRSGSSGGHPPASPAAAAGKLTVIWPKLAIYARSGHMTVDFTKLLLRRSLLLGRSLGRSLLGRPLGPLLGDQLIGALSGQALHRIGLAQGGIGGPVGDVGTESAVLDHHLLARDRVLAELLQRRLRARAAPPLGLGVDLQRLLKGDGEDLLLLGQ